jgi:phenylalanyl-tRNA synthetase alpha chain
VSEDTELAALQRAALADVAAADTLAALEEARVAHTGRRSPLATVLSGIGKLPPDRRGPVGKEANLVRRAALAERQEVLETRELSEGLLADRTDVTLPGAPLPLGALHPIVQVQRELEDVLQGLGYAIADGPEIEDDFHNFDALNHAPGHPARLASHTLLVEGAEGAALRPQTSPVQIRVMESTTPPVYVVAPGAVYRKDDVDATHSPMFHQMEGLAVDEGLTLAHLKGTLLHIARELFGEQETWFQSHFFPFTEPSIELYVAYVDAHGRRREMELLGAGMVDPNVLRAVGCDPERYTGFAFGMGLDRVAMVRYGLPDLRLLFDGDLRFLEQLG